jgi:hypothetical protein
MVDQKYTYQVLSIFNKGNNMSTIYVNFTAYRPGSVEVITEGSIPVQASSSVQAIEAVKAMYSGLEVVIRGTRSS